MTKRSVEWPCAGATACDGRFHFIEHRMNVAPAPGTLPVGAAAASKAPIVNGFNMAFVDLSGDGRLDIVTFDTTRLIGLDMVWLEQPAAPAGDWLLHGDGDMDFITTCGNSGPYDGVLWLEQIRSAAPLPAFQHARANDSPEVPLPAGR